MLQLVVAGIIMGSLLNLESRGGVQNRRRSQSRGSKLLEGGKRYNQAERNRSQNGNDHISV
jgi:hypothetical protein